MLNFCILPLSQHSAVSTTTFLCDAKYFIYFCANSEFVKDFYGVQ